MATGNKIDKKISRGLGKAASKVGQRYDVFQSTDASDPLAMSNFTTAVDAWFKEDGTDSWRAYFNKFADRFAQLLTGSYFNSETETYFIGTVGFNDGKIAAVLCNETIDVFAPVITGTETTEQLVYTAIPVRITTGGASEFSDYAPLTQVSGAPIQNFVIRSGAPKGTFVRGQKIRDSLGNEMQVQDVVYDNGFVIKASEYAYSG